jgi:hypothetical protein
LRDSLANFDGSHSNDGIQVCVVERIPAEDLDSESAFLDIFGIAVQGLFDGIAKKIGESFAVPEEGAGEDSVQLLSDSILLCNGQHRSCDSGAAVSFMLRHHHAPYYFGVYLNRNLLSNKMSARVAGTPTPRG